MVCEYSNNNTTILCLRLKKKQTPFKRLCFLNAFTFLDLIGHFTLK